MPANATSHRPTAAVSYTDSARTEKSSPQQGEAFRSALDSAEESKAPERRGASKHKASEDGDDRSNRRGEATTRAEAEQGRRDAETKAVSGKHRPEQSQEDPPSTESSGGGFGSDPPVLDSSEAGGSVRAAQTPEDGAAPADMSAPSRAAASSTNLLAAVSPGTGELPQMPSPASPQPELLQAGQRLERGSLSTSFTASTPDGTGGLTGANTSGADAEAGSNSPFAKPAPGGDLISPPLQSSNTDSEFKLGQLAGNRMPDPGQGADSQGNQAQGTGSRSVEAGLQGPAGTANRAGLEGAGRSDAMPNLYTDPEPLPGSVRLRGLRGARLVIPTGNGEMIKARVDLTEEQVDVRLAAPEGSSQLAERRVSELRQALAGHGMELGDFDVSTSEDSSNETSTEGSSGDSARSGDAGDENNRGTEVDPWGRPIGAEPSRGSAMDGRGALLDLRL